MNLEKNTDTERTQISVLRWADRRAVFRGLKVSNRPGRDNYVTDTDRSADTTRTQRGQYDDTEPRQRVDTNGRVGCVGWLAVGCIADDVLACKDVRYVRLEVKTGSLFSRI